MSVSETPRTADEALERAIEYVDGRRSDGWNDMISATEGGVERSAGIASVAAEDAAKSFAWSAVSIAMRAQEKAPVDAERERMLDLLGQLKASLRDGSIELTQHYNGGEEELLEHLDSWLDSHGTIVDQLLSEHPSNQEGE